MILTSGVSAVGFWHWDFGAGGRFLKSNQYDKGQPGASSSRLPDKGCSMGDPVRRQSEDASAARLYRLGCAARLTRNPDCVKSLTSSAPVLSLSNLSNSASM
jgi:hypothetical protein